VRNFLTQIHQRCPDFNVGSLTLKELEVCAQAGVREWGHAVTLGRSDLGALAVRALALVLYPKAFGAKAHDGTVEIEEERVPPDLREFIRAGALNAGVHPGSPAVMQIVMPRGTMMEYLLNMTRSAARSESQAEVEAFVTAARTNDPDKGHAFERMLACEATLLGSRLVDVVVAKLGLADGFKVDPRAIGQPFVYAPNIPEAMAERVGQRVRVFCVQEDMQSKGRSVDVGVPLLSANGEQTWTVFFELKYVKDQNTLWRQCWTFFQKVEGLVCDGKRASAVFLSMNPFTKHVPAQPRSAVKKGESASDSKRQVERRLREGGARFAIVEMPDVDKDSVVFPLHAVLSLAAKKGSAAVHRYPGGTPAKS